MIMLAVSTGCVYKLTDDHKVSSDIRKTLESNSKGVEVLFPTTTSLNQDIQANILDALKEKSVSIHAPFFDVNQSTNFTFKREILEKLIYWKNLLRAEHIVFHPDNVDLPLPPELSASIEIPKTNHEKYSDKWFRTLIKRYPDVGVTLDTDHMSNSDMTWHIPDTRVDQVHVKPEKSEELHQYIDDYRNTRVVIETSLESEQAWQTLVKQCEHL